MLRTIVMMLFIIVFFILSIPLFLIEWIVGKFNPKAKDKSLLAIVQPFCRFLLFLAGAKVTTIGLEKIPKDECVLYVLNHRSMFDILLTLSQFPGPTGYVAKKELGKVPGLNLWITTMHGWFLDREDIREGLKIILACIDQIKNGVSSIAIFPEGTRNKNEEDLPLLPFHEGSFKISLKTGCAIVPVCISGSIALFEKQFPKVRPSSVVVEYMDPIYPDTLDKDMKKQIGRQVRAAMEETMKKNQAAIQS